MTFDWRLSFRQHVESVTSAAYKTLGFILRNFKSFNDSDALLILYKALVRPKHEYACVVWSLIYDAHVASVEKVTRLLQKSTF